jgi:hypothetical protein
MGEVGVPYDWDPLPLSLLSSTIVKLSSQADQVPYQSGELAFWMGDTLIPQNRGF